MSANRARYLDLLGTAAGLGEALRRTGMSEADVAVNQLVQALSPLNPLLEKIRLLASYLGVGGTQSGFSSVLRAVFGVATPARIAGLVTPLVSALRDRLKTLIDQILAPVRAAIDTLQELIDLLDLQPVIDGIEAVFQEVRTPVARVQPERDSARSTHRVRRAEAGPARIRSAGGDPHGAQRPARYRGADRPASCPPTRCSNRRSPSTTRS